MITQIIQQAQEVRTTLKEKKQFMSAEQLRVLRKRRKKLSGQIAAYMKKHLPPANQLSLKL